VRVLLACCVITFLGAMGGLAGCTSHEMDSHSSQQEDRGMGIVRGTLGTIPGPTASTMAGSGTVQGQVLKLEGGAYVLRTLSGDEMRLSLDENTVIDRPAHVGDHIEASFDENRRTTQIRNIDAQVKTGQ
jgi:hypothetical protein